MSLYYETAKILTSGSGEGSLKSMIYRDSELKSKPDQVFALISEASKYDDFVKEVIDNSGLLSQEPKLTPLLSILLLHDHLFSKGGIAAPSKHPLRQAVERHKARLQGEFTRARLRRRCGSVEILKKSLASERAKTKSLHRRQPRWIRINTLKSRLQVQLDTTFNGFRRIDILSNVFESSEKNTSVYIDENIPDLVAIPSETNITTSKAYENGSIILQDKASCFPAYMLLGNLENQHAKVGDIIDACAAPGNKTTHLAAFLSHHNANLKSARKSTIFACERDSFRHNTLERLVTHAGAGEVVSVLPRQDFLALNPHDARFANVTHLLLDPSCSGSGIVGREDVPVLALPDDPRNGLKKAQDDSKSKSKKRKRKNEAVNKTNGGLPATDSVGLDDDHHDSVPDVDRLLRLSNIQSRLLEHAFTFPATKYVTYSTCSIHVQENEEVVSRALASSAAKDRGWQVLSRREQVQGLSQWRHRGISTNTTIGNSSDDLQQATNERYRLTEEQREACIRCAPGDQEGTMGFFVCGFVRPTLEDSKVHSNDSIAEDLWEGFSDSE